MSNLCLSFISKKNLGGKKEIRHMLVSNIVSSKTLHEKNFLVKTHERKEYNVKHSTGSIIQEVFP
jgi:hypothetical protein